MKVFRLLIFLLVIFARQNDSFSQTGDVTAKVNEIANKYLSNPNNVGLAIGIYRKNINPEKKSVPEYFYFGEIKKNSGIKPDDNTIFKVGSIGKTFSAMLLSYFITHKEYNVTLNDYISKFLPENIKPPYFKTRDGSEFEITLLDLATHFSSLPRTPPNIVPPPDYTIEKLNQYLETSFLKTKPGTAFLYSNLGFGVLGYIMTLIGKKSYQQLENEIFCNALGMNDTRIELNKEQQSRLATSYRKSRAKKFNVITSPGFYGSGGNYSTMNDMMKYLSYNLGFENVSINSLLDTLHAIRKDTGKPFLKWMGLGWQISEIYNKPGTKFIWKDGATNGYTSYIAFDTKSKTGVVVLSNSSGASDIGNQIINILNKE